MAAVLLCTLCSVMQQRAVWGAGAGAGEGVLGRVGAPHLSQCGWVMMGPRALPVWVPRAQPAVLLSAWQAKHGVVQPSSAPGRTTARLCYSQQATAGTSRPGKQSPCVR
jgi:hypothetical protein